MFHFSKNLVRGNYIIFIHPIQCIMYRILHKFFSIIFETPYQPRKTLSLHPTYKRVYCEYLYIKHSYLTVIIFYIFTFMECQSHKNAKKYKKKCIYFLKVNTSP